MADLPPLPPGAKLNSQNPILSVFDADADSDLPPLPKGAKLSGGLPPLPPGAKLSPRPTASALPPLPPGAKLVSQAATKSAEPQPGLLKRGWDVMQGGTEQAIKGAANLESGIAAPFLSQEQRDKLQKAGLYTPRESPVKEYSQAVYSGIMAPVGAAIGKGAEYLQKGATKAGVPQKTQNTVGDLVSTGMDIAGVAGIPGNRAAVAPRGEIALTVKEPAVGTSESVKTDVPKDTHAQIQPGAPDTLPGKPAPEKVTPESISDELFRMSNKDEARRINYTQALRQLKGVTNDTWEKLYAHADDPKNVPVTPQESALYDKTFGAMDKREAELRANLKKAGVAFDTEVGAAPRKVKGRNELVEKIYGNPKEAAAVRRGKSMSTFSPTMQARSMFAIPDGKGARAVVYVNDGRVFHDGEEVGKLLDKDKTPSAGLDTTAGKLAQATTAEIENATKLQYHKNLLANKYLNIESLERANDATEFLEKYKASPEFRDYATPAKESPEGWRPLKTDVKAFDGWKFKPDMAEVFEDYLGNVRSPEEYATAVTNVAKAMRASIFYNPIRHMINATNMFATSLGAVGGARDIASLRLPRAMAEATKSVLTMDKEFRDAMKEGLSLPSARNEAAQFHEALIKAMGRSIHQDPQAFSRLAKEWGYKSTVGLIKGLYSGSSKLLWNYSDILTMARYKMYRMEGLSAREAVKRTHQVIADYRVKSRVLGSRKVSQALQNPMATMFGRYDYNRMANLAGLAKRAAKNDAAGWRARDQLLALAVITTVGYKILDPWLQKISGNDDAHFGMGGYSSLVDVAKAAAEGRKSPLQAAMSAFSPGLLSFPYEAATQQNAYSGKPIVQRGDWNMLLQAIQDKDPDTIKLMLKRLGYDEGTYLAGKFAPVEAFGELNGEDLTPQQRILQQLGVNFPKDNTKALKYELEQSGQAAKKRGF